MTVSAGSLAVVRLEGSHRLEGSWTDVEMANSFLTHLEARGFSPATVRAYAFDLLNFGRFLGDQGLTVVEGSADRLVRLFGLAGEVQAQREQEGGAP